MRFLVINLLGNPTREVDLLVLKLADSMGMTITCTLSFLRQFPAIATAASSARCRQVWAGQTGC